MTVFVTVRDGSATEDSKNYAIEKGERLRRYFRGLTKVDIILGNEGQSKRAEAILSIAKAETIAVHADHEQMNAAIDLMIDRAQQSLTRHKEKVRKHRGGATPPKGGEEEREELESYQQIVDETEFPE